MATITLASPQNRNALSRALLADLAAALERATADDVRAIVLTHLPPVFCAGADLKERSAGFSGSDEMIAVIERLEGAAQPTIAAVKGPVRAGGLGVMAACDLIVVAETVDFAFTEVRLGLAPAIIAVPILRRVPWSKLAAAFLTGETFGAATAVEIGLVTHVAADGPAVDEQVGRLVEGVLAGGPEALALTKRLLRELPGIDQAEDFRRMQQLSDDRFDSAEGREGMAAFLERRRPSWRGTD